MTEMSREDVLYQLEKLFKRVELQKRTQSPGQSVLKLWMLADSERNITISMYI